MPADMRYQALDAEDEASSLERISHFKVLTAASSFIGREPAIPVTYFSSKQEGFDHSGVRAYDQAVIGLLKAYVARFSPGKFVLIDSPHFMEPAIPDDIEQALRDVIAKATG